MKRFLLPLFLFFLLCSNVYGAAFTSAQNGNWNDGGTFGNNSPGVKGTDWPGTAGDTASIGHTVTYNVSETNELGQVDITNGGILTFSTGANTKLTLAHQNLNVASGGELRVGASGAEINAANTAEVLWNTTSDNAKGLQIADGGTLSVYGASDYCSDYEDTLANDAENTDGDVRIKTVTDMSAIWHAGDELTIKVENAGDSTSYQDAIKLGVIQSFEAANVIVLDITITAAAGVGNTWISPVVDVTRNVQFGKLNASTAIANYNTNRPQFIDNNADGNDNCYFSYAMATGFYSIDSDHDFQFLSSTVRNCYRSFYSGAGHTVSGNVYSNNSGFYYCKTGYTVSGNVYSNNSGFYYCTGHTVSGNVYSNYYGFYSGTGHTVSGNVYSNYYGFSTGDGHTVSGRIGYDSGDVSKPNTTSDFYAGGFNKHTLLNAKNPLAGLNVRRNIAEYITRVMCEHHDRTAQAQKIYDNNGDVVKVACDGGGDRPSEDPDGGNGNVIELSNIQSLCDTNNPLKAWEPKQYRIWATNAAGAKTYTFKVQTTYAGISAGNLKLTAEYLDGVSGGSLSEQTNAPAINIRANDTDWTQTLAVTVNPSADGWIDFMIELMEYESGDEVWIWPTPTIS